MYNQDSFFPLVCSGNVSPRKVLQRVCTVYPKTDRPIHLNSEYLSPAFWILLKKIHCHLYNNISPPSAPFFVVIFLSICCIILEWSMQWEDIPPDSNNAVLSHNFCHRTTSAVDCFRFFSSTDIYGLYYYSKRVTEVMIAS